MADECECQVASCPVSPECEVSECPVMDSRLWGPILSGAAFFTFLGSALTNWAHIATWERMKRLAIQSQLNHL